LALLLGLTAGFRFKLICSEDLDLSPSLHWPEPKVLPTPASKQTGQALVTVEYQIDPKDAEAFKSAARRLGEIRKRDGALYWNLFHDTADAGRYLESYVTDSWAEHLRQHGRVTKADKEIEDVVMAFHIGPSSPRISHLIAE
jgi:hypothetical protein